MPRLNCSSIIQIRSYLQYHVTSILLWVPRRYSAMFQAVPCCRCMLQTPPNCSSIIPILSYLQYHVTSILLWVSHRYSAMFQAVPCRSDILHALITDVLCYSYPSLQKFSSYLITAMTCSRTYTEQNSYLVICANWSGLYFILTKSMRDITLKF